MQIMYLLKRNNFSLGAGSQNKKKYFNPVGDDFLRKKNKKIAFFYQLWDPVSREVLFRTKNNSNLFKLDLFSNLWF